MARIRSIKPDFWTSGDVLECSLNARLMFIGMWNFADDCGRLVMSAKSIKAQIFPGDEMTAENILGMVSELVKNDLVLPYAVDGKDYLEIKNWHHQRIDKPQDPKCPPARDGYSKNIPGMIPPDRIGKDKIGEEGKGERARERTLPAPVSNSDFERFWKTFPNRVGKADAQRAFARASKKTSPEVLFAALDRYVNKTDDRPWCNPSTWLNQERWSDQPAVATGPPSKVRQAFSQGFESLLQSDIPNDRQHSVPEYDLDLTATRSDRSAA